MSVTEGEGRVRCIATMANVGETVVLFDALTAVTDDETGTTSEEAIAGVVVVWRDLLIRHLNVSKTIIIVIYHVVQETELLVVSVGACSEQQIVKMALLPSLGLSIRLEWRLSKVADRGRSLSVQECSHPHLRWAVDIFDYEGVLCADWRVAQIESKSLHLSQESRALIATLEVEELVQWCLGARELVRLGLQQTLQASRAGTRERPSQ